jgi:hypothetical protein
MVSLTKVGLTQISTTGTQATISRVRWEHTTNKLFGHVWKGGPLKIHKHENFEVFLWDYSRPIAYLLHNEFIHEKMFLLLLNWPR